MTTTRFQEATAVRALGDGRYGAGIDKGFWVVKGPNGGYLAAVLLRALQAEVGEPERAPRSLTVHYLAAPVEGPVEIVVEITKRGRSVAFARARMFQDQRVMLEAVCAFAAGAESSAWQDVDAPDLLDVVHAPKRIVDGPTLGIQSRFDVRPVIPADGLARTGGWLRSVDPEPMDACLAAAYTDAWFPAPFMKAQGSWVPTVDLTIHFHTALPPADMAPEDHVIALFWTDIAGEGVLIEDGRLWTPGGRLLVSSRQLALLR